MAALSKGANLQPDDVGDGGPRITRRVAASICVAVARPWARSRRRRCRRRHGRIGVDRLYIAPSLAGCRGFHHLRRCARGVLVVTIAPGRGSPAEHGAAGLDRRGSPAEHGGHARHWQSQSGIMSGIRGISGVRPAAYIVQAAERGGSFPAARSRPPDQHAHFQYQTLYLGRMYTWSACLACP